MYMIEVKTVSKIFKIPHEKKNTIFEVFKAIFAGKRGYEQFVAIKDISFAVERGEWLGIIGPNGSGKSTLLKIIANTIRPSKGEVRVNGKITSLLELGIGFQPDLTAKENIEIYGAIMELSDREIEQKIDQILDFGGISRFRDTKLKNFSNGMMLRLAFSTAIQIKPEILLLDEVLAVGDLDFQKKCYEVFENYKKKDITVVFVSHDLVSIQKFCDRVLLINHGEKVGIGDPNVMIEMYRNSMYS